MRRTSSGFTLIELMIAVAVVGILAAVAYPNYSAYVRKTHRYEIAELISEQAQTLERFYTRNATYVGATGLSAGNSYYGISSALTATTYTLTATPSPGSMMVGDMCGNYTLDNTGLRGNPGAVGATTKDCWGR
ncbi:type IV pilin protein [Pseudomonas sp. MWU13-2105]|uniref:type IV pilin protein n=1 Tax=Pseudomonas sp. MWU13-2105 TaxID=2935074 RepID=UPI00200F592A|nr:type IV pilin protein [Pseudomonas sp. MWU13-2105]